MTATETARAVLEKAALIDPRVTYSDATVDAWASIFDGRGIFPEDALDAVRAHYAKPRARRIMPGEIVDYCHHLRPWHSPEHASQILDVWAAHPYTPEFETHAGIRQPETVFDAPDHETAVEELRRWVDENRWELTNAILTRHGRPGIPKNA
ncbi:hypothetical protein A5780_19305 [Nocardia sp. 852002-20019_SCH5090214]|uniref:hypothetical protein n=1 Tax=Nocardia sp. 852002-20019_SCH5090214 TaxID=1834087 RepID=UPI0007EB5DA7|nr:hypothetical protein [Nocardia sp. 852002-20019_SCH5090214]OBA62207.1 hypothetical protein A5780_19305 [Nocardia sp. 852002-20019_SCH5090214]